MLKLAVCLQGLLSQSLDTLTRPLRQSDRGVTSVEYALLLMLIALVIFAAVALLGKALASVFGNPQLP